MGNKISKSDQDPRQTDRDRSDLERLARRKSQHFAVGTDIVRAPYRRGTILAQHVSDSETHLLIAWYDGRVSSITPIALNRRAT